MLLAVNTTELSAVLVSGKQPLDLGPVLRYFVLKKLYSVRDLLLVVQ